MSRNDFLVVGQAGCGATEKFEPQRNSPLSCPSRTPGLTPSMVSEF